MTILPSSFLLISFLPGFPSGPGVVFSSPCPAAFFPGALSGGGRRSGMGATDCPARPPPCPRGARLGAQRAPPWKTASGTSRSGKRGAGRGAAVGPARQVPACRRADPARRRVWMAALRSSGRLPTPAAHGPDKRGVRPRRQPAVAAGRRACRTGWGARWLKWVAATTRRGAGWERNLDDGIWAAGPPREGTGP